MFTRPLPTFHIVLGANNHRIISYLFLALELREDIETVIQPGMVLSMEPHLTIPDGQPGAGGYREHDIMVVTEEGAASITGFPYGPEHNIIHK